jgi:pyridoxal 5'-phosphate synthase pdxT subunit
LVAPLVGVLALQGDVREHVAALEAAGARTTPLRAPGELAGLDGVVIPGGESTAIGRLLGLFDLLEPLRDAVAQGLPAYGSCAGLVLLADEVLDGLPGQPLLGGLDVSVRRNAFGSQVDSFETDVSFAGAPLHAVFIRAPWVERVGPSVEVLARVASYDASARLQGRPQDATDGDVGRAAGRVVAVRQGAVLATAFHPELTGDTRVHGLFVEMIQEARG